MQRPRPPADAWGHAPTPAAFERLDPTNLARERADAARLYEMDLASWRKKARAEGRVEGETRLLLEQLSRRFGPLTDATRTRVQSATVEQLEIWGERVLTAQTLDDVLAP